MEEENKDIIEETNSIISETNNYKSMLERNIRDNNLNLKVNDVIDIKINIDVLKRELKKRMEEMKLCYQIAQNVIQNTLMKMEAF